MSDLPLEENVGGLLVVLIDGTAAAEEAPTIAGLTTLKASPLAPQSRAGYSKFAGAQAFSRST